MKKIVSFLIAVFSLSFMLNGCGGAKLSPEVQKEFDSHATMYTQVNMHYNINRRGVKLVEATNYQVGILIPVNSKVTLIDINSRQIAFEYKGHKIILKNIPKYTGLDMNGLVKRYFGKNKVNLSKFSSAERKAIESAKVIKGMSKDAVLVSLGYPPAHRTPSLKENKWTYWHNRWKTFVVEFKNSRTISEVNP